MNHSGDSEQLSPVCSVQFLNEAVVPGVGIIGVSAGILFSKISLYQVLEEGVGCFLRDIKSVGHLLHSPRFGPASPEQQESFQMWDAFDLFKNEIIHE